MTAIATTNPRATTTHTTATRTTTTTPHARLDHVIAGLGARAEALGGRALRFGLVLILVWIGAMKFTA